MIEPLLSPGVDVRSPPWPRGSRGAVLPDLEQMRRLLTAIAKEVAPDASHLSDWNSQYFWDHHDRLAFDLLLCTTHVSPGSQILEIGSIPPYFATALQALGYRVVGVDLAPERFRTSLERLGLTVHRCDIEREQLPFATASFETVLMNEVLEHLRIDLVFTLSELHRVIAPGGTLMLSTPNLRSLRGIYNLVARGRAAAIGGTPHAEFRKLHKLGHMGHVREYTPVEVRELLEQCGFEVRRVIFRGACTRVERLITWWLPHLRPFFTMIVRKPAGEPCGLSDGARR